MINNAFEKLLQEQKESGLSVRNFCANQDIAVSTFYHWRKKLATKDEVPKEFVPLLLGNQDMPTRQQNIFPSVHNDDFNDVPQLEFVFPNGTKVHLKANIAPALLKTIVHLYD
jgi:hypothetical protein